MTASADLSPVVEMLCAHEVPELLALRDHLRSKIAVLEVELAQVVKALERKLPSVDDVQGIFRDAATLAKPEEAGRSAVSGTRMPRLTTGAVADSSGSLSGSNPDSGQETSSGSASAAADEPGETPA